MKKLLLIPLILLGLITPILAQDDTTAEVDSITLICNNLLEIILSHQEGYFESLEGEVLFMQDDSLKAEWDPKIYLIDGTNCVLSEVWGAKNYTCRIEDWMFTNSVDEIYDMMRMEVMGCLGEYCEFGERTDPEVTEDEIIYRQMWAKLNDYFEAGITIGLYQDEENEKYFKLVVY